MRYYVTMTRNYIDFWDPNMEGVHLKGFHTVILGLITVLTLSCSKVSQHRFVVAEAGPSSVPQEGGSAGDLPGGSTLADKTQLRVELLLERNTRPAMLSVLGKDLMIVQQDLRQVALHQISDLSQSRVILNGNLFVDVQLDPSGWLAACYESGTRVALRNINDSTQNFEVSISEIKQAIGAPDSGDLEDADSSAFCGGVSVDLDQTSGQPAVWVTMPSEQKIVRLEPKGETMAVVQVISGVSGTFEIQTVGNYLFTNNVSILNPKQTLPLVLSKITGEAVAGDKMGREEETRFKRRYWTKIYPDALSSSVFYMRSSDEALTQISSSMPNEDTALSFKVPGAQYTRYVLRKGSCVAVVGATADDDARPTLSVIRETSDPQIPWSKIGETITIKEVFASGAVYYAGDADGNIFLSNRRGVSVIRGLFSGLNCD